MPHHLQDLFARALDDEPLPPPGDPVRQAMAHGRRIRRRRGLLAGGTAAVVVVATAVALNLALTPERAEPPRVIAAALMAPPTAACTWPVQADATDVSIFLRDDITPAQLTDLHQALTSDPAVRVLRFENRELAYQRFKILWAASPDFVAAVDPGSLPESFRVDMADPAGYRQFADRIRGRAGVGSLIARACPEHTK